MTLVQASRSPSVVSVALQIPQTGETPSTRLTCKFSSDTSLWQILRRIESGAAGDATIAGKNYNFTQRATAVMANGGDPTTGSTGGAGRLCYEMPVFNVLGRQLETFADLQKTLAQLGISGSAMLRLEFRNTQQPLEEAMMEIQKYFEDGEGKGSAAPEQGSPADVTEQISEVVEPIINDPGIPNTRSMEDTAMSGTEDTTMPPIADQTQPSEQEQPVSNPETSTTTTTDPMQPPSTTDYQPPTSASQNPSPPQTTETTEIPTTTTTNHGVTIFSPPTTSTPYAASTTDHTDIPTTAQALAHQALLNRSSRNTRLASDAELATRASDRAAARTNITSVIVRLRFMDQSIVQRGFRRGETVQDLYGVCEGVLETGVWERGVELRTYGNSGGGSVALKKGSQERLIEDLGWSGRVLVTVVWSDPDTESRRKSQQQQQPLLKPEYRSQAQELKVDPVGDGGGEGAARAAEDVEGGKENGKAKGKAKASGEEREARTKRLLGKMGVKK